MIDTLFFSLHAIMPILLLIVLGYLVRRFGSWDGDFFKRLNGLGFHLFMPVQLFRNVYDIEHIADVNWRLILYLVASIFLCLGVGVLAARLFVRDHEQKGAIAQATFRSNQVLLGIPLAVIEEGSQAVTYRLPVELTGWAWGLMASVSEIGLLPSLVRFQMVDGVCRADIL